MKATLYSNFHNCTTEVRKVSTCNGRVFISDTVYRAARKRVCGQLNCLCGGGDIWRVDGIRHDLQVYDGKGLFAYELVQRGK